MLQSLTYPKKQLYKVRMLKAEACQEKAETRETRKKKKKKKKWD